MSAKSCLAVVIGGQDRCIDLRRLLLQPGKQRGAKIKTHSGIVIDNSHNPVSTIENARGGIGGITLGGDAFVPVMIRLRRVLQFDSFQPWILPRWLVEVTVYADIALHRGDPLAHDR